VKAKVYSLLKIKGLIIMANKSGIWINPANKGRLHKALGVKKGAKIPVARLRKAAKSKNETLRKRAQFALNARKFKH